MDVRDELIKLQMQKIEGYEKHIESLKEEINKLKTKYYNSGRKTEKRTGQHSKYPGVSFDTVNKCWIAKISINHVQKVVFRGSKNDNSHETELAAAEAYKKAKENKPKLEAMARAKQEEQQEQFRREMRDLEVPVQRITGQTMGDVFGFSK